MRISIVTPVYNGEKFIIETITSVLNQRGDFDLEYIIVDGKSTDNTLQIINKFKDMVDSGFFEGYHKSLSMTVISEKDTGMYDALAKGFALCTGDIMAYINSDDFYYQGSFSTVLKVFRDLPQVDIFNGKTVVVDESSTIIINNILLIQNEAILTGVLGGGLSGYYVPQESIFWRKKIMKYLDVNTFRKFKLAGDFYLWYTFAQHTKFYSADILVAPFRVRQGQLSSEIKKYNDEVKSIVSKDRFATDMEIINSYNLNITQDNWQERYDKGLISLCLEDNIYIVNEECQSVQSDNNEIHISVREDALSIFCASDDNYAPYMCTLMYSVLEHTQSYIIFYVLDGGISEKSKKNTKESLSGFDNFEIEYIDMESFELSRFPNLRHYSLNAFSRYFIPQIKPDIHKALYLDVDIIARGDVAELFHQDLEGYPLGAVLEDFYCGNYTYLKENIYPQYAGGSNYLNSGVLLMDCKAIRDNRYIEKLVNLTIELYSKLSCPDQDIYNIVFENNFKILDYRYNYMPDHFEYLSKLHPTRAEDIRRNAVLIHYTGGKPWKNQSIASVFFLKTLEKTKFYVNADNITVPLLTVITITYNLINAGRRETFLRCVESVKHQTYANIEHIIIDGASDDGTLDLIKSTGLKYYSEKDNGIYDAMNKGIDKANGKYITFLNSDDYYYENIGLDYSISMLEQSNADYCYSDARITQDDTEVSTFIGSEKRMIFGYFYCHQSQIVKLDVIKKMSGFNTDLLSADNDLMLRLFAMNKKGIFIPIKYVSFDNSGFSTTISPVDNQNEHISRFYELFGERFKLSYNDCRNIVRCKFIDDKSLQYKILHSIDIPIWRDAIYEMLPRCSDIVIDRKEFDIVSKDNNITLVKHYLFGIPILRIAKDDKIKRVNVLGIPISRRERHDGITRIKILGLQAIKFSKNDNVKRLSLLGIPIIKKTRSDRYKRTFLFGIRIYKKAIKTFEDIVVGNLNFIHNKVNELNTINSKLNKLDMIQSKVNEIEIINSKLNQLEAIQLKVNEIEIMNSKLNQLEAIQLKVDKIEVVNGKLNQLSGIQSKLKEFEAIQVKIDELAELKQQNDNLINENKLILQNLLDIKGGVTHISQLSDILYADKTIQELISSTANDIIRNINNVSYIHLPASNIHRDVFNKYKNINEGKKVVLLGAGTTLNDFVPIKDAVYIGVNRTFKYDKVKLDYLFIQDNLFANNDQQKANKYDCKKFYGRHYIVPAPSVSDYEIAKAEQFYFIDQHIPTDKLALFSPDITARPLNTWSSIIFPALEFALWTNPAEIYLVGCDCTPTDHFDNTNSKIHVDNVLYGWQQMSKFIKNLYPHIKMHSINPLGLQGLFKDLYYIDGEYKSDNSANKRISTFILNDTTSEGEHIGCSTVMQNMANLSAKYNLNIIGTMKNDENYERHAAVIERADIIILNGEGTLHHDNGVKFLEIAKSQKEKGKKVFLINSIWEKNPNNKEYLKYFDLITVRESNSLKEVKNDGANNAINVPDLVFYSKNKADVVIAKNKIAIFDNVLIDKAQALKEYANKNKYDFYFLTNQNINKFNSTNDIIIESENNITNYEFIVSGRFHILCFALKYGIPVLSCSSNTFKIEGLLYDVGLEDIYLIKDLELLDNEVESFISNDFDEYKHKSILYCNNAIKKIDEMFRQIRQSALSV